MDTPKRKRGRPRKNAVVQPKPPRKYSENKTVILRVTQALFDRIKAAAEEESTTIPKIVRQRFLEYYNNLSDEEKEQL